MKKYLLLLTLSVIITKLPAQELIANENGTGNTVQNVVVNHEMIKRFNDVKTDGDIYSWSQLLVNRESSNVLEFVAAYANCNMDEQSLESLKLALEEKAGEMENVPEDTAEAYYAFINRIKQEISDKLGASESIASK